MKMKMFFTAIAVLFTVGVVTSCGNKKASASAEETTEQTVAVSDSVADTCCQADSMACDSVKACCAEKAEGTAE